MNFSLTFDSCHFWSAPHPFVRSEELDETSRLPTWTHRELFPLLTWLLGSDDVTATKFASLYELPESFRFLFGLNVFVTAH